jgi:hypothetical protein
MNIDRLVELAYACRGRNQTVLWASKEYEAGNLDRSTLAVAEDAVDAALNDLHVYVMGTADRENV